MAQWGYDRQEGEDLILRIEIGPADLRGNLAVWFEIAHDCVPGNRVRGPFLTNYPRIDVFRNQIAKLMNNELEEAQLTGS